MSSNKNTARKLNHYKLVNQCETLEELADVIEEIAEDNNGWINGKTRSFDAAKMADNCLKLPDYPINSLTRNYGIRSKAISILYYTGKLNQPEAKADIDSITLGDIIAYIQHMA